MIITETQAKLLHNLHDEITSQLGVRIGYCSLYGAFYDEKDDFIIHEEGHVDVDYETREIAPHFQCTLLVHRLDYEIHRQGILSAGIPSEFPCHDDKCEEFLKLVLTSLENGKLTNNPSIKKEFNKVEIKATKKGDGKYSIVIDTARWRTSYTASKEEIKERSVYELKDEVLQTIEELETEIAKRG